MDIIGQYTRIGIAILILHLSVSLNYAQNIKIPVDTAIVTEHSITIDGKTYDYIAETGFQPVWNDTGKAIASLHYTYYKVKTDDTEMRPLAISFNGGPGAASVWMHIGYTGPVLLNVDEEGYPVQPYGLKPNEHSILDVADIVYVNPVNTGYSRVLDKEIDAKKQFFGVNQDIKYLAAWISSFVHRKDKWLAPKYLIGESYGTVRSSGLALQLQNAHWMYLNGVILVSPTNLGIKRDGPIADANNLPYYAVTAWYHSRLNSKLQAMKIEELAQMVEEFTIEEYIPALQYGSDLEKERYQNLVAKIAEYSGLSEEEVSDHNLTIPRNYFWKALERRESGYTIGRLDSRYRGLDSQLAGTRPQYNAELTTWLHAFTPPINWYFKNELGFNTDVQYKMFGSVHPWEWERDNTGRNLSRAMAINPFLHVMIQSGYYDGGTPYYDAKYTLRHLDRAGNMQDRLSFKVYESGHMMYMRAEVLGEAMQDIKDFIKNSIPTESAKY